jgi:hypothetical protein
MLILKWKNGRNNDASKDYRHVSVSSYIRLLPTKRNALRRNNDEKTVLDEAWKPTARAKSAGNRLV